MQWPDLPGTKKEGLSIANIINSKLLVGEKATALAVQNSKNPKILHIASHAYYLENQMLEKNRDSKLDNRCVAKPR